MSAAITQQIALQIAHEVYMQAKQELYAKLDGVVVFGSYARNDFDAESDLDIMIRIRCSRADLEQYEKFFSRLSSRLSLEYNITVSIVLSDVDTFMRFRTALPFYRNIDKEGIRIA